MQILSYTRILGASPGARIGIVKFYEMGYYLTDFDNGAATDDQVEEVVRHLNAGLGIPDDVATSAARASCFGWHCPCADKAIEFFKSRTLANGGNA